MGNQTSRTHIQVLESFLISASDIQANYLIFNLETMLPLNTAIGRAARRTWRTLLWLSAVFSDVLTDKEIYKSLTLVCHQNGTRVLNLVLSSICKLDIRPHWHI